MLPLPRQPVLPGERRDRHGDLGDVVRALRPQQWTKNLVVLGAPMFALRLDAQTLGLAGLAFATFSAVSSAVYLVNDVMDREADRRHPSKRHRPIAAGRVSIPLALSLGGGLVLISLVAAVAAAPLLALVLTVYLLLQLAYNLWLKQQPILDIMAIAAGFALRAVAGGAAVRVPMSGWFLVCLGFLALYLGIEKRKAEVRATLGRRGTREVLQVYTVPFLDRMEAVVLAATLITYGLWAVERMKNLWMLATLPVVAYGIFRYQLLTEQGHGEEPERTLLRSPHLLITIGVWVVVCLLTLSLGGPAR